MFLSCSTVSMPLRLVSIRTSCLHGNSLCTVASNQLWNITKGSNFLNQATQRQISSEKDESSSVLVLGSSGALGRAVSKHLGRDLGMDIIGADLVELENSAEYGLRGFVGLPHVGQNPTLADLTTRLIKGVGNELNDRKLAAIVVASGGWEGDPTPVDPNATNDEMLQGAAQYSECIERMMRMNLHPVVAAGHVAERFMGDEGLFVAMGATAALSPTPGMVGYGLAKSAAHHFIQTLGTSTGKSATSKPKRKDGRRVRSQGSGRYLDTLTAIGILPTMIDTPANRKADPKADFSQWTKPIDIATEIGMFIKNPPLRPHSGSLIKVFASAGEEGGATFNLAR